MKDDKSEILLSMFHEYRQYARHHETQRANLTSIIVVVAAGLIAFIGNKDIHYVKWPMCVFLIIVGLFGAVATLRLSRKARLNSDAAVRHIDALEKASGVELNKLRDKTREEYKRLEWSEKMEMDYLWAGLHTLIAGVGFMLLWLELRGFFLRNS